MTTPPCAICGAALALALPCQREHADHCHACWATSLSGGLEARQHRIPEEALVLSPRDLLALARYTQHVQRTVGTQPLLDLREEDTP